jgi:hypothetical protein
MSYWRCSCRPDQVGSLSPKLLTFQVVWFRSSREARLPTRLNNITVPTKQLEVTGDLDLKPVMQVNRFPARADR